MAHSQNRNIHAASFLPVLMIAFIGAAYALMGFFMPPLGDDLGFYHSFAEQNDCWYSFPRSMYRHWLWGNARFADMITPVGLNFMPQWLRSISNGIVTAVLFYIIVKLSLKRPRTEYFLSAIIISLAAITFRWDAIWMEFCATYNYVWGATFILSAVYVITKTEGWIATYWRWLLIPFCFIAAAMHEAAGMPMAIGMTAYIISSGFYKRRDFAGKLMTLAFIAGGIFTLTSPASYSRVGSMLQPEPPLEMLAFSAGYVVILFIAIICLFIWNRNLLKSLIRTSWIAFAVAAVFSTGFMLISQYGGRTGWFAQIFALIAIFQIISRLNITIPKCISVSLSLLLCAATLFHYSTLVYWQIKLGVETYKAIGLYKESSDGIIFMDYTNEPDLPWYLLRKTHGVPDDDDSYYRYRMSKHYGNGKQLVILPAAAKDIDWSEFNGTRHFGDRIISDHPFSGSYIDMIVEIFPRTMVKIRGKEYIETGFNIKGRRFFLYSPVDRDPGEK